MKSKSIEFNTQYSLTEVADLLEECLHKKPINSKNIGSVYNEHKITNSSSKDSDIQIVATGRDFWSGEWAVQIYVDERVDGSCNVRLEALGQDFVTKLATGIFDREEVGKLIHLRTSLKKANQIKISIFDE